MTPHTPLSALDPHTPVRLFPDDEFRIVNATDASKQLAFDLSAIATGTTRTVTMPNSSGTMALLERAQTFTKLATFALGLTVAGAAFASRGIQDNATATALTLSGSGANSITMTNSASDPVIGTTGGALLLQSATGAVVANGGANVSLFYGRNTANTAGAYYGVDSSGNAYAWNACTAVGSYPFYVGNGSANNTGPLQLVVAGVTQVLLPATAGANRYITLTGSNGGSPTIGASGGTLKLTAPTNNIALGGTGYFVYCGGVSGSFGGNIYYDAGFKFVTAGYGGFIKFENSATGTITLNVCGTGAAGAAASANAALSLNNGTGNHVSITPGANPAIGTGAGDLQIKPGALLSAQFTAASVPVNYVRFQSRNTGSGPILWAEGSDTDVNMEYRTQNAGSHLFITDDSAGTIQVNITHTASANRYITLTGSNGGNPTIGTSAGSLGISTSVLCTGTLTAQSSSGVPAGGGAGFLMGTTAVGMYWGSGVPAATAAKGSIYLRTDGSATNNRAYINTDGGTTWTALTTAA